MRIKKIAPVTPANGNIENSYGTSQENTYSQEYINDNLGNLNDLKTSTKTNLVGAINEVTDGITKYSVENGKYLKLFTIYFKNNWKCSNITFSFANAQNNTFSQIVNLYCHKQGEYTPVTIINFKSFNFVGDLKNNLLAIPVDNNKVEVYYLCQTATSPSLNIITQTSFYSEVIIDMNTSISTLPSGTPTYVSNLFS